MLCWEVVKRNKELAGLMIGSLPFLLLSPLKSLLYAGQNLERIESSPVRVNYSAAQQMRVLFSPLFRKSSGHLCSQVLFL